MLIVPLVPAPSQVLSFTVAEQSCTVKVYTRLYGMFVDLYVDSAPVVLGVICQNLNRIVRSVYLGFKGDFIFIDNQGSDDPVYTGLGPTNAARFVLAYLSTDDLAAMGFEA